MKDKRTSSPGTRKPQIGSSRARDSGAKEIFDNHTLCAQFLRDYVDVGLLKDVQPEDIEDISERFLELWQENRDSDSVKKIRLHRRPDTEGGSAGQSGTGAGDTLYLLTLIEHQHKVDHSMSFRILRYIVQILTDYEKEMEAKEKGCTTRKDFRYPPVLPIVFFDGSGNWTAATDFRERVFLNDVLGDYIPAFQYLVVPLSRYSNRELIEKKDELSLIMLIDKLRSAADFRALRELPEGYLEEITKDSPESVLKLMGKLMAVLLLRLNVPKEEIEEFTDRIERREFAMLFPNFEGYDVQETRRKSRAEGMAEGRALSVLSLLEDAGPVSEELRGRILEETDQETLERWLKLAARTGSIEDFKAQM